ncbi:MAG: TIGR01210 family radical SAM protein [Candidatus Lokiarchaeota archaeon]|nr:TIGR01210 family radical SAM protein [Candidatus Lokiarchaeota archaeon]
MANQNNILRDAIAEIARTARKDSIKKRKKRDLSRPASKWIVPTRLGNKIGTALSIVLSTVGCSHASSESGGCTMCSYLLDGTEEPPTSEQIVHQFQTAMHAVDDKESPISVKLYTSGSFLDSREVSDSARSEILQKISEDDRVEQVVIESRPEYVNDSLMSDIRCILGDRIVEIGIGLESISDSIRSICINKGFTLDDFTKALETCKEYNIGIRAYVLVKPPFLTERDALLDSVSTIVKAAELGVSTVSVNPVNVQSYTLVEKLWRARDYRPPWLWTVVEILKQAREAVDSQVTIVCDPVAAGKSRGTHNCGDCDTSFVKAIRSFSLEQNPIVFGSLSCDCKREWQHILSHEDVSLMHHI